MPNFDFELPHWRRHQTVIGVDEVGRGCFAGPLTVGAVAIPPLSEEIQAEILDLGIRDSKLLTGKRREELSSQIITMFPVHAIVHIDVSVINTKGIMTAIYQGMQKAIDDCKNAIRAQTSVLIDGLPVAHVENDNTQFIVKGDNKSISIASAAIIAKVARDALMNTLHTRHPQYDFESNKGYGTISHREALKQIGVCEEHRTLYVRKYI